MKTIEFRLLGKNLLIKQTGKITHVLELFSYNEHEIVKIINSSKEGHFMVTLTRDSIEKIIKNIKENDQIVFLNEPKKNFWIKYTEGLLHEDFDSNSCSNEKLNFNKRVDLFEQLHKLHGSKNVSMKILDSRM